MDAAEREWQRLRKLGESGIQSGRTIDLARLRFERARADYLKAKADDDLLLKGDPIEDIKVADEEVKRAQVNLELAKKRLQSEAAYQVTQVQVAKIAVDRIQAIIDLQQERIDGSRVTAPTDGIVVYPRRWGMPIREGDPVWANNRFLDIADLSKMRVESAVSQIDWPRVKIGQKVELRLIAYPEKLFHGTVSQVGGLARDRSVILKEDAANVMSFSLRVDIDEESSLLKPSYSAEMSIITDTFENAIAVPRAAVMGEGDKTWVWVTGEEGPERRDIVVGPSDAVQVVVNQGLDQGEQVLVPRRTASE
jgi:HlyD family secretion protein